MNEIPPVVKSLSSSSTGEITIYDNKLEVLAMAGDLEIGNQAAEEQALRNSMANNEKEQELDEYSNLVRYISTYRDKTAVAVVDDEEEDYDDSQRPWYAFWRKEKGPAGAINIPAEWLETDINRGLTSDEVEKRRRKAGFNELADIKENLFLKFIGFFRGPVLYGKPSIDVHKYHQVCVLIWFHSHGDRCSPRRRSACLD